MRRRMILIGVAVVSVLIAMVGLAGAATDELVPEVPVQAKINY